MQPYTLAYGNLPGKSKFARCLLDSLPSFILNPCKLTEQTKTHLTLFQLVFWLIERLTSPFSTKIGYIRTRPWLDI